MDIDIITKNSVVKKVRDAADATGSEVYIIGGQLRDLALKLSALESDYDFVVFGDIGRLTKEVAELTARPLIRIGKEDKEVIRIVKDGVSYDFTPAKGATLDEDLIHRDFTINTLAYSLRGGELIDLLGSMDDIKSKTIRAVSDTALDEDPLRMLRAFRFMATLRFSPDEHLLELITEKKRSINRIPGERIRDELLKILAARDSYTTIRELAGTGLLYEIFPELKDSVGCEQNDYHHLDVMEHVLEAYGHLEDIFCSIDNYFLKHAAEICGELAKDNVSTLIKYALILHDVAKPETKETGGDGRVHFYRHAEIGEERVQRINAQLRLSKKESAFTCSIVRNHLRIVPFLKLFDEDKVTKKSILRYFLRTGGAVGLYEILHNLADLMASRGIMRASEDEVKKVVTLSNMMLDIYFGEFLVKSQNPPLITGRYLIDELGMKPSPIFKRILDAVYEKQISGEITTKDEAIHFVKQLLT